MPILHVKYAAGTTGTLTFICPYTLYDTVGNVITPPFDVVATLNGATPSVANPTLLSGVDPDVSPNPWAYRVLEEIDGQDPRILFVTMPLTDTDAVDVIVVDQPPAPELFLLRSEFTNLEDALGNPVSEADVDASITEHNDDPTAHAAAGFLSQADADTLYDPLGAADDEEARATAAELALSDAIDAEETARIAADATEVTNRNAAIAVETAARMADVDAEEARALAAEALLAPKANAALTGNPTAPTPTAGDNDTSIATTQFVTAAITTAVSAATAALIDGAPGALDTLNELAAALNDDAAFSATVTAAIAAKVDKATLSTDGDLLTRVAGAMARITRASLAADTAFASVYATITDLALKAPLASPALTGNPTAPTQTPLNNSTRIATTAYTDAATAVEAARAAAAEILLAPLASPTLTGDPKAPTPATADNDTSIATTAWGQTNFGLLVPKSLGTTKGDLPVWTASGTPARHGVGANGTFLVADSAQTDGWNNRVIARSDLPQVPKCSISDAAVSIATGTGSTIVGLTATESIDPFGYHSDVTNPSRITVPSGHDGPFWIAIRGTWASNATGQRRVNYLINGGADVTMYLMPPVNGAVTALGVTLPIPANLAAGDFVQISVAQTSGGALNFTLSEFTLIRQQGAS